MTPLSIRAHLCMQVLWLGRPEINATWEPAKSLPDGLVQEFEAGVLAEATVDKQAIFGHTSGTLTVSVRNEDNKKKMKIDRPCLTDMEGCVAINDYKYNSQDHFSHAITFQYISRAIILAFPEL